MTFTSFKLPYGLLLMTLAIWHQQVMGFRVKRQAWYPYCPFWASEFQSCNDGKGYCSSNVPPRSSGYAGLHCVRALHCDTGNLPTNFVALADSTFGDVAELVCPSGQLAVGSQKFVQCLANGQWSTTKATCIKMNINMALGKSVMQSGTMYDGVAERAVDGCTNTQWSAGSCMHTEKMEFAWWIVDLGYSFPIVSVVVYNRGDCCGERLSEVYIMVSDTMTGFKDHDLLTGTQCDYVASVPQGEPHTFTCAPGVEGRYVKLTQNNGVINLAVCEVEVYVSRI